MTSLITLKATDFSSSRYCENEWLLTKWNIKKVQVTPKMLLGRALHSQQDSKAINAPVSEVFVTDSPIRSKSPISFQFQDILFTGIPDEVYKNEKSFFICEDKLNPNSNKQGYVEQLYCYGFIFSNKFAENMVNSHLFLKLRQISNLETFFDVEYSNEVEQNFLTRALYLRDLLLARVKPSSCPRCLA